MAKTKSLHLIQASILAPALDWLNHNGANTERHLDYAQIPGELVESGALITKSQAYRFLAEAVEREGCDELGFAAYRQFRLADLGPVATAMQAGVTFKESLEVFCRLAERAFGGNVFWLADDGTEIWLCNRTMDNVGRGRAYAQHLSLMILVQIIRTVAGDEWCPRRIRLQDIGTTSLRHSSGFDDCEARFKQSENAVAFPRAFLGCSLTPSVELDQARNDQELLPIDAGFTWSLQRLLEARFPHRGLPTMIAAAEITGVSPRTVRRRLYEDGITYRGLLDRIRFNAAKRMLTETDATAAEIADELGYYGHNNFFRAFKRVSGMSPVEYRRATPDSN